MNLYECRRGKEGWEGAILIFAENEEEAKKIYHEEEKYEELFSITKIELIPGIIYNDYLR